MIASCLIHSVLIFGISFILPTRAEHSLSPPPMKIMLVSTHSAAEPEHVRALAQHHSIGPDEESERFQLAMSAPNMAPKPTRENHMFYADSVSSRSLIEPQRKPDRPGPVHQMDRSALIHHLQSTLHHAQSRPRERIAHTNTRASDLAPYLEKWRLFVERVGNQHYPRVAKARNLEGSLVLDAAIRADGSVDSVTVLRSSGHVILDDSAEHIVRIAAPFDPFPDRLRREYDILHIVRTWKFSQSSLIDVTR